MPKYNVFVAASSNSQNQASIGANASAINNYVAPKLPNVTIQNVAAGLDHTLFLMENGHVYACGGNSFGQLGDGTTTAKNIAILAFSGQTSTCVSIAAGRSTSYAITEDGKLYAWGSNVYGQLGTGDSIDRTTPTRVGTASNWIKVVIANGSTAYHMLALNSAGEIYGCGLNTSGQLGQGDTATRNALTRIGTDSNWTDIAVNEVASYAVKSDGTLWACGGNTNGSQGNGLSTGNVLTITRISSLVNITKVFTCNSGLAAALNSSNQLFIWGGTNSNAVLRTTGTIISGPSLISGSWKFFTANTTFSIAIATNGDVYAAGTGGAVVGRGPSGSIVFNSPLDDIKNAQSASISTTHSFILVQPTQKLVYSVGKDAGTTSSTTISTPLYYGYPRAYLPNNNIKQFIVNKRNDAGVNITSDFKIILTDDNKLYGWGGSVYGVFGDYGYDTIFNPYSSIHKAPFSSIYYNFNNEEWKKIAAGVSHAAYLSIDGTLVLAGTQYYSSLAYSTGVDGTIQNNISITTIFNDVDCGDFFTIAIGANNRLYGCGINNYGQVGIGSAGSQVQSMTQLSSSVLFSKVSCGLSFTFGLSVNNQLYTWGRNLYGQLGLGNNNDLYSPTFVVTNNDNIVDIACGYNHGIVLKSNGTIWGCGLNNVGQLGTGVATTSYTTLTQIGTASNWVQIFAFADNTVAINSLGEIYICGSNASGQIATGLNSPSIYRNLTKISQLSVSNPTVNPSTFVGTADGWFGTAYADSNIPLTTTTTTTTAQPCFINNLNTSISTSGPTGTIFVQGVGGASSKTKKTSLQAIDAGVTVGGYTNNTGTLIVFDGDQSGSTFTVNDLITFPFSVTAFSLSGRVSAIATYRVSAIVDISPISPNYPNTQALAVVCSDVATTTTTTTTSTTAGPGGSTTTTTTTAAPNYPPYAYVSNADSNTISIVEVSTGNLFANINLPGSPTRSFVDGTGNTAYVILQNSGSLNSSLCIINTSNGSIRSTLNLPSGFKATWISVDTTNKKAYISSDSTTSILVLNTITGTISEVLTYPTPIRSTLIDIPNGLMYCCETTSDTVGVFNLSSKTRTATISVGGFPYGLALNSSTNRLYVSNFNANNISVINTLNNTVTSTISGGSKPIQLAINPSTQRLYAVNLSASGTVTVINTSNESIVSTINIGSYPQSIALDTTYNRAIVTSGEDNQVQILNLSNNTVYGVLNVGNNPLYVSIGNVLVSNTTTTTTTTGLPGTTTTTTINPALACIPSKQFLRIQLRRGTNEEFVDSNLILASGEPAYALDTNIFKIGDGIRNWTQLDPIGVDMSNPTDIYVELQDILVGGDRISFNYDNNNQKISINSALEPQVFQRGDFSLSANQNNLNLGISAVVKVIPSTNINITGILAGQNNEMKLIYNGGNNNVTMMHNSSSSSVGNRIFNYTKQNFILSPDHGVTIIYDSSIQSWRLF